MVILVVLLASVALAGQTFISAKAGLVNYEEGVQAASPRQLQEGEVFSTPNRCELLMMPGAYIRLERSAEVRMLSTSVSHPEVELLNGLVSVEVNEMPKESGLTLSWGDYRDAQAISISHRGLYRFEVSQDGSSLKVMVQTGQLRVGASLLKDGEDVVLSPGHMTSMSKFDRKLKDDFDIWAANRDQLQSVASYRTASAVGNSYYLGNSYYPGSAFAGGMGNGMVGFGSWAFNPGMGFFTYLPSGMMTSPWGYYYYSPGQVANYPCPVYGGGYGYGYGCGYGYGSSYNNGYGYSSGNSSIRAAIGTTPSSARVPVYGTVGGNGSNGFSGTSSRSGAIFSGSNSGNSGFSAVGANSASSTSLGGAARSSGGSSVGGGGGAAPSGRH
jgi:hypothetical protein